jgi:hypothetical protein
MVARCFGSNPPPTSGLPDVGKDARAEAAVAIARAMPALSDASPPSPHPPPQGGERPDYSCGANRTGFERITRCAF